MKNEGKLKPGTVLFDYQVLDLVAEGGWAYVYKAKHLKLPRQVAIKQLKPDLAENEKSLRRFLHEASIVAQLSHPNIVTIHSLEHDEETGLYYIVTEFAEKGSLADHLKKSPEGLSIDEALSIAMGICDGLEAVHRKDVIHRDLKPGNVLMFDVGKSQYIPKLCDFGVARAPAFTDMAISPTPDVVIPASLEASTSPTSGAVGTFYYMSPEQLGGEPVDHRSDLYSLGILLYELLTGQVPFIDEPLGVFWAHMYESPTPPSDLRPDIPKALEQAVLQVLRKSPEDRFQSVIDMHEALKATQNNTIRVRRQRGFKTLLEQGQKHLENGEWEAAIEVLKRADVFNSENEQVKAGLQKAREQQNLERLYNLGIQHLEGENWEEAQEHLADVLSLDPNYADGSAKKYLEQAMHELKRKRTWSNLMVRYRMGMGYFRKRQWRQAITELEEVMAHASDFESTDAFLFPTPMLGLEEGRTQVTDFEVVADWLAKASQYLRAELLFGHAQNHIEREEWEEAANLLGEIMQLNPPHIDVASELENTRTKWDEARIEQQILTWYDQGIAQLKADNLKQAKSNFEKIDQRRPNYRDVASQIQEIEGKITINRLFAQASKYESTGEWKQVIDVCGEILAMDPLNQEASRCLARAQRRADRPGYAPLAAQKSNWIRLLIALVAGGLCTFLVTLLAQQFLDFDSWIPIRRVFSIVFLWLIFAYSFDYFAQRFVAQRVSGTKNDS